VFKSLIASFDIGRAGFRHVEAESAWQESGAFSARAMYAFTAASNRPLCWPTQAIAPSTSPRSQALLVVRTVSHSQLPPYPNPCEDRPFGRIQRRFIRDIDLADMRDRL